MRILIVCSKNSGRIAPFIVDQVEALIKTGVSCDYFTIEGKGIRGYLQNRRLLLKKTKKFQPDLVHAHYGLSGLLANTQRKIPVVTTYHGSDINNPKVFVLSRINMLLSAFNIFVSKKNIAKSKVKSKFALIPCGVDTELFRPIDKKEARKQLGLNSNEKLVLFAGSFSNAVKNPELAKKAIEQLENVRLLELRGYNRNEVAILMNAVDACLMTSNSEGSPQFIKEALACNSPIVSVNVGDVNEMIQNIKGCFIVGRDPLEISQAINNIIGSNTMIQGKEIILSKGLEQRHVVKKLLEVYKTIV